MKVIITGGLGFIGQNLARWLRGCDNSIELVAIDWRTDSTDQECALFDVVVNTCFADEETLPLYKDADAVVHLAAYTTVQESIHNPHRTFENNVGKTERMLEYARLNAPNIHFIFSSTGGAIIGEYDGEIHEEIAARPISPYGASKLAIEGLMSAYNGSFNLRCVSLRFSNVYGPYSGRKGSVVAAFCKSYVDSGTLQINGDGRQTRDYVYVDDICRAIEVVIQKKGQGLYQLGTGIGTSILELADVFQSIDPDKQIERIFIAPLSGEVRHNVTNCSRIEKELGFTPTMKLQEGVKVTMKWFQKNNAKR